MEPDDDVAEALELIAADAQERRGAASAAAAWRRAAELTTETNIRARRLLASSESAWEAGSSDAARRGSRGRLSRTAATRCCTRTSCASGAGWNRGRAAWPRRSPQHCRPRPRPLRRWTRCGRHTYWPMPCSPSSRRGIPSSNVEIARAARAAAGESDDPLFDYVLGWELAREGSTSDAARLVEAAERAIVGDPGRRADPRALMLAADCAWWRSGPPRMRTRRRGGGSRARARPGRRGRAGARGAGRRPDPRGCVGRG